MDDGVGLGEAGDDGLFDTLTRTAVGVSDDPDSAGLGLSICRHYVEAFSGRIEAENRPGGGALFRVSLPCARATGPLQGVPKDA